MIAVRRSSCDTRNNGDVVAGARNSGESFGASSNSSVTLIELNCIGIGICVDRSTGIGGKLEGIIASANSQSINEGESVGNHSSWGLADTISISISLVT